MSSQMDEEDLTADFLVEAARQERRPTTAPTTSVTTTMANLQLSAQTAAAAAAIEPQNGSKNMAPEPQEGNIEYKLKLLDPTPERITHLVTQMKWRLAEGNGEMIYEIGVEDGGVPAGLTDEELAKSIETLKKMAAELHADVTVLRERPGMTGKVAEVLVRHNEHENRDDFLELRIAVLGNVDAGKSKSALKTEITRDKSTLLGVLTHGELDNGRGLARLQIFRHKHEIETGRTSSISHESLSFDSHGEVTNYGPASGTTPCKVVNFIDLAGHEKYLRTTLFGMTGHQPDFAMLIIGSNMGVIGMTKEHLGISLALRVPVFFVVSKIDVAPENVLKETLAQIKAILKSPGCRKIPIVVRSLDDVIVCARNFVSERLAPIFLISSVTGKNLDLLRKFINLLPSCKNWDKLAELPLQFDIDSDWHVPGSGTVVSGTVVKGVLDMNEPLLLGPDATGKFQPIVLKSIHVKRMPVKSVHAGQSASMALRKIQRKEIRKGMVIISPSANPQCCVEFEAEILVLYHATTIAPGYEAVVHMNSVKQTARVIKMDRDILRTGDKSHVTFRFLYWPEFVEPGSRLIFREGRAKGVGRLLSFTPYEGGLLERHPKKTPENPPPSTIQQQQQFVNIPQSSSQSSRYKGRGKQQQGNQQGTTTSAQPLVGGGPQPNLRHSSADVPKQKLDVRRSGDSIPKQQLQTSTLTTATEATPLARSSNQVDIRKSSDGLKIVRPQTGSGGSSSGSSRAVSPPISIPTTASGNQQQNASPPKQGRRGSASPPKYASAAGGSPPRTNNQQQQQNKGKK